MRSILPLVPLVPLAGAVAAAALMLSLLGPAARADDRSLERLRLDCSSDLGRWEVTLFANGTVRLREGPLDEEESLELGELGPEELEGYLNRIDGEDLSEVESDPSPVMGEWVERCILEILPRTEKAPIRLRFSRYSTLSLPLARLLALADELAATVGPGGGSQLPVGYRPRVGDLLERSDGTRFRVVTFTADRKGVELEGEDTPLVLYVALDGLTATFDRLLARDWASPPRERP